MFDRYILVVLVMRVVIHNFKSIERVALDLAPLTILVGPPAGGKSNILDAVAITGYPNRLLLLDREYGNNASNLEPPTSIARFTDHPQLFKYHDLSRKIVIDATNSEIKTRLEIFYEAGKPTITINGVNLPWDFKTLPSNSMQDARNALEKAGEGKAFIEARLYGYDRYGLASSTCSAPTNCGFHLHFKGMQTRSFPVNIMSEFGWNAPMVIKSLPDVVVNLNRLMKEHINEEVEARILRSGVAVIFDYGYEVEMSAVSDSIFRILYYLMAIRSAMNYVKLHGLEGRFILMLEEPEAHIFPFFLDLLADYIVKASEVLYMIITMHNPLLVSKLWDKVRDVKTYYVFRGRDGSTNATELDVKKLAEELKTAEEVLYMPPDEVVEQYSASKE